MSSNNSIFRWQETVAGCGAGFMNVAVTYPLHKVMFRQMVHGFSAQNAFSQLRREGLGLLYRGSLPPLCQKALSTGLMFGGYYVYTASLLHYFPVLHPQVAKSLAAGFAGFSEALFFAPFERVQTLLLDKHYNSKLKNSYHAVTHIWRNYGLMEFYRGASTIVIRNSFANIVFFAATEKAQQVLPTGSNVWTRYLSDFMSGALIGAALSSCYFPINVVKSKMQMKLGGPFESPLKVARFVFNERGRQISKMYTGVHLNYTRSFASWGIINASFKLFKSILTVSDSNGNR